MIIQLNSKFWRAAAIGCLAVVFAKAHAFAEIEQGDTGYLAWEAEGFDRIEDLDTDGIGWDVATVARASGGRLIVAAADAGNHPESDVIYRLRFAKPGQYHLYARYHAPDTNSDTLFFSDGKFGAPADAVRGFGFDEGPDLRWQRMSGRAVPFVVSNENVGKYMELRIGVREPGFRLDRLVLTPDLLGEKLAITDVADIQRLQAMDNSPAGASATESKVDSSP